MKYSLIIIILSCLFFQSCVPSNEFEKNVPIPGNKWNNNFKPHIEFEISDTNAHYNMFFMMRHTDAYPFSNIWILIKTKEPNATEYTNTRVEIPLAQPDGKWLGRGMKEIYEHKLPLTSGGKIHYSKKGKYVIALEQIMRENPLNEVMNVGIRLEKIK